MKTPASYELSVHHFPYIHQNLAELSLSQIPLTVPTRDENVLINSDKIYEPRRLVVETVHPGKNFVIRRDDERSLQVIEADNRRDTYGQELFHDPLEYLVLSCDETYSWRINTSEANIVDTYMLREFVGILSTFALSKQLKLQANR